MAEIAKRQVGQLTRMGDDLLETSRLNFDKFHLQLAPRRPARGRHGSGRGEGLDLAVARDLVVAHRGRIEVESAGSGSGARFTVIVPLAAPMV